MRQILLKLTDAEMAALREFADHHGVTPTRAATLAAVRTLQARRIGALVLSLDDSHAALHQVLPAIAERLRSGELSPEKAASLIDAAHVMLADDYAEMLDGRAHVIGFRGDNAERASIDWATGRTGAQTELDARRAMEAAEKRQAEIDALKAELDRDQAEVIATAIHDGLEQGDHVTSGPVQGRSRRGANGDCEPRHAAVGSDRRPADRAADREPAFARRLRVWKPGLSAGWSER